MTYYHGNQMLKQNQGWYGQRKCNVEVEPTCGVEHTCGGGACCCRDYSSINSVEASCCPESLAALKACLDRVKGKENYIHCSPRYTTCLCVCGGGGGRALRVICVCIRVYAVCV